MFGWTVTLTGMVAAMLIAPFSTAYATSFTLSSFSVDIRNTDPGLVVWYTPINSSFSIDLTAATPSQTVALFSLGTNETAMNWDDLVPYPISVDLSFSSPAGLSGNLSGITGALGLGYVTWDSPVLLPFGAGGLLSIGLSNAVFGLPGSAPISATFSLVKDSYTQTPAGVPEPTSIGLLSVGLVGLALYRRKASPAVRRR